MGKKVLGKRGAGIAAFGLSVCLAIGSVVPAMGTTGMAGSLARTAESPIGEVTSPTGPNAQQRPWITATDSDSTLNGAISSPPDGTLSGPPDSTLQQTVATASNSVLLIGAGDLWKDWLGDMSFLSGDTGKGTAEEPYQISTKAQLMGLAVLAAHDMTISEGDGTWPGEYEGACFQLTRNIDLGGTEWMPVGFYQTEAEMPGGQIHAFRGNFDGNGKIVSNFRINAPNWDHIGFFGAIEDSEIKNLTLRPSNVLTGKDMVGLLAGSAKNSRIYNVTVSGALKASGTAGGVAGEITEGTVLENLTADHVAIDSGREKETFTGGITGRAADSVIVDCTVNTGDSLSTRLAGGGFVGGITGFQNSTGLFNVHVMGTVGGNGSQAIGGITGKYASGKIKVARFEGTVASSGLGSASREGTFIGTREQGFHFRYGTGAGADAAYLYADSEAKINSGVCGSGIAGDNQYTYDAHVGFWNKGDNYFTLVQGSGSRPEESRYFYEELEEGVLHVIDAEEDVREFRYRPDHFAPNPVGRPARGYLVSVLQIDTAANVQNYYDVAAMTAKGESVYCRTLDKSHRGAVAAGDLVTVFTAPRNTGEEKYQMDGLPTYTGQNGRKHDMAYQTGGSYTFVMPECDTELSAVYKKVAAGVQVEPEELSFKVVQERKGDRKNPNTVTEVRNQAGKLIARYIDGQLEQGTEVQDVRVEAIVDKNNDVADSRISWSVDDGELIRLKKNDDEDSEGYTEKSASLELNLNAGFFTEIMEKALKEQADKNFRYPIPDTIYGGGNSGGGIVVLTACTRPSSSFEGKPLSANSRIQVTYQIKDRTVVAAEGALLDKNALSFTVTRKLTGNRLDPVETITVTEPQSLTAEFHPDFFSKKDVSWESSDTGIVQVFAGGYGGQNTEDDYKNAAIHAVKDARWIQNIIAGDQGIHQRDPYCRLEGKGSRRALVTVAADDALGNKQTAVCEVQVNFVTEDRTSIIPEKVSLDHTELTFDLVDVQKREGEVLPSGFNAQKLAAVVAPGLNPAEEYEPYDRSVGWVSSDPGAVTVKDGTVMPDAGAEWIMEARKTAPYYAEKTVTVTAGAKANPKAEAGCQVRLIYKKKCLELDKKQLKFDLVLMKSGSRSRPVLTWSGADGQKLSAAKYHIDGDLIWSQEGNMLIFNGEGTVLPNLGAEWLAQAQKKYPYTGEAETYITAGCGEFQDICAVKLTFKVVDNTYSSGGSGSSGGGASSGKTSSGGSTSAGITTSGVTNKVVDTPEGSITGTWIQDGAGNWLFTGGGRTYADEWGYIHNPYAAEGQSSTDWYRFDADGHMQTGWYREPVTGDRFYFHSVSDGSLGTMYTGWHLIDGKWFYFSPVSDGRKGRMLTGWNWILGKCYYLDLEDGHLYVDMVTPDGFTVNENGAWTVDGAGQQRE